MSAITVLEAFTLPAVVALGVNAMAGVFILPAVREDQPATSWLGIFGQLCLIAVTAIVCGAIVTANNIDQLWGIIGAAMAYLFIAEVVLSAHRHTQLVGLAVSIPAFLIGEIAITGDIKQSWLLTGAGAGVMFFFALNFMVLKKWTVDRQPK